MAVTITIFETVARIDDKNQPICFKFVILKMYLVD